MTLFSRKVILLVGNASCVQCFVSYIVGFWDSWNVVENLITSFKLLKDTTPRRCQIVTK
jgi:hypothetical protein